MASFTAVLGHATDIICVESPPGRDAMTIQDVLAGKSVHLKIQDSGQYPFNLDGIGFNTLAEMMSFVETIRLLGQFRPQVSPKNFNGYIVNGQFYIDDIEGIRNLHKRLEYQGHNEWLDNLRKALWTLYTQYCRSLRAYPIDYTGVTHCIECDSTVFGSQVIFPTHFIVYCKKCTFRDFK